MKLRSKSFFCPLLAVLFWLPYFTVTAQPLTITSGVQTYGSLTNTTVTMSNRCELRLTATTTPMTGCTINLNSSNAWLFLTGIKPSVAATSYLGQVLVNGAAAVADSNCRVVQYGVGAVIIPQPPSFQPLQIFSGPHFTGVASNLSQYVYYTGTALGSLNATISSFKLKRGYMATLAQNASGSGYSKNYVAADGDMEISILPATLDDNVRFVYVTPWRWGSKKGFGETGTSVVAGQNLNLGWNYSWDINQNSTRDREYVGIRQTRWWPGLGQNWQARGVNTVLGYNEPDNTAQANILVGDAIWSWPDLLGTGLRVGSPAVTDGGRSGWLYPFISQADAAGLRVDFVAVHYYWCFDPANPAGATTQLYNFLKATYDQVKRPIWITEWNNGANWTTCGDPTYAQQQAAVAQMLDMLETTPFVERYAIYNWVEDVRRVAWDDGYGSLTAAGVTYRDKVSALAYVQALQDNGTRSFAQLRFETNTLDASGYGNNGITAGCPAYTNGHNGQALVFDGTNTVVTLPPNVANNTAFSFAAWIKWNGGANWQRIFDFGNSPTQYMFLTPSASGGYLRFAIKNGGGEQTVQTAALISGAWQHVAVTLSGSTANLYVNGVLAASNTGMSITPASFSPRLNYLGKSQYISDPLFSGWMDDVTVTDYALSAAQIASLQTNTPPQFTNSFFTRGTSTEGVLYSNTLTGTATDADPGDTLTYSKAIGPAWLNIAGDGTMTGKPTSGDGGTNYFTVRVTDAAGQSAFALTTISVIVLTASGTWTADASANWGDTNRWSGNIVASGAGQTANFSTLNITGDRTVTLDSSRTIGNLKFSDTSGAQAWTLAASNGLSLKLDTGSATPPLLTITNTATISAPVTGTNGFTKTGTGTLILNGNNPLSGAVHIDTTSASLNDGITRVTGPNALANASKISIGNNNSGSSTFQLDGSAGSITIDAELTVNCRNNGIVAIENMAGTNIFNGTIWLYQGGNQFTVQSDTNSLVVFTGTNIYIGALVGSRAYNFTGAGNHLAIGPIVKAPDTNGSPIALTKSGAGILTLANVNTYTNGTTLTGGSLIVDGTLPAGSLAISSGTTLGGSGVIKAAVTLPFGAILTPGDNLGTLTVSNSVILQAGSTTLIELNKAAGTNDLLRVSGSLAYGGTLVVTNLGGTLWAGDTFQIFSSTIAPTGAFTATNLPALPAGFNWQWAAASGMLSISSTVALNPTNVATRFADNTLQLSWPDDHLGWRLQIQTNTLESGVTTNWLEVPGSAATNQMNISVDPGNGNVFYRLIFP